MERRDRFGIAAALLALLVAVPLILWAADGDSVTDARDSARWQVQRFLICDSDTGVVTCAKKTNPAFRRSENTPYDYYRMYADEDDSCTSYTVTVRDYPINTASDCEGACDAHDLITLDSTGLSSKLSQDPLGEAFDADITAISSCTLSVYIDFFYRANNR